MDEPSSREPALLNPSIHQVEWLSWADILLFNLQRVTDGKASQCTGCKVRFHEWRLLQFCFVNGENALDDIHRFGTLEPLKAMTLLNSTVGPNCVDVQQGICSDIADKRGAGPPGLVRPNSCNIFKRHHRIVEY